MRDLGPALEVNQVVSPPRRERLEQALAGLLVVTDHDFPCSRLVTTGQGFDDLVVRDAGLVVYVSQLGAEIEETFKRIDLMGQ